MDNSEDFQSADLFPEIRRSPGVKRMRELRLALMKAINNGDSLTCASLFEQGVTPHFSINKMTPLRSAICRGSNAIVEMVLCARASPDSQAGANLTPIQEAIRVKNIGAIELLLRHGANVHTFSEDGRSTLDVALETGFLPALRLLLDLGLHPLKLDANGRASMDRITNENSRQFLRTWLANEAARAALEEPNPPIGIVRIVRKASKYLVNATQTRNSL